MKSAEEIIKSLECCCRSAAYCDDCGYFPQTVGLSCMGRLKEDALELIRRLTGTSDGAVILEKDMVLQKPSTAPESHDPGGSREAIIEKANQIAAGSRQGMYGKPERNFRTIAGLWSAYLGAEISPDQVCVMMTLLKVARMRSGHYREDNAVDAVNYLLFAAELAQDETEG